jgi:hypothetical protein
MLRLQHLISRDQTRVILLAALFVLRKQPDPFRFVEPQQFFPRRRGFL